MEQVENLAQNKIVGASNIVNKYIWWAAGGGAIPVPVFDIAAVSAVQLKMIKTLSEHYDIEFKHDWGKSFIAALLGGIAADQLTRSSITSWAKSIPVIGIVANLSMPIYSGAMTYAVGKVFIQHFESGGTFLDFDPEKVKAYFAEMFKEGTEKGATATATKKA